MEVPASSNPGTLGGGPKARPWGPFLQFTPRGKRTPPRIGRSTHEHLRGHPGQGLAQSVSSRFPNAKTRASAVVDQPGAGPLLLPPPSWALPGFEKNPHGSWGPSFKTTGLGQILFPR